MEQKILIFKIFFIFFIFFSLIIKAENSNKILGRAYVIDGDTIHIDNNKIRLHGIDAPEIKQKCFENGEEWRCGLKSKIALENLISNQIVYCETINVDKYRRFIATCFVNNQNINQHMVVKGWAIAYRYYSKKYVKDEEKAKKNMLGIWIGKFQEPYLFRKNNN